MTAVAPAKVNLCLYLGPTRADGLHELCSLFIPISLADRLEVVPAEGPDDEVICAGVDSPDLTARALGALREAGWRHEALRVEVDKRIPVAAGLGGGSADAAAILRLAAGELDDDLLAATAASLGADVPSQLAPGFALVEGAGERITPLPEPEPFSLVLLPDPEGLSTAAVYAEADRLNVARSTHELDRMRSLLLAATAKGAGPLEYAALLVNDLAAAAVSLRTSIAAELTALEEAGAALALMSGSGPTAVGLFARETEAEAAAGVLRGDGRQAIVARSGIPAEMTGSR